MSLSECKWNNVRANKTKTLVDVDDDGDDDDADDKNKCNNVSMVVRIVWLLSVNTHTEHRAPDGVGNLQVGFLFRFRYENGIFAFNGIRMHSTMCDFVSLCFFFSFFSFLFSVIQSHRTTHHNCNRNRRVYRWYEYEYYYVRVTALNDRLYGGMKFHLGERRERYGILFHLAFICNRVYIIIIQGAN